MVGQVRTGLPVNQASLLRWLRLAASICVLLTAAACRDSTGPATYRYTLSGALRFADGTPVTGATIRLIIDEWPASELYSVCVEGSAVSGTGVYSITLLIGRDSCGQEVYVVAESAGRTGSAHAPRTRCLRGGESVTADIVVGY